MVRVYPGRLLSRVWCFFQWDEGFFNFYGLVFFSWNGGFFRDPIEITPQGEYLCQIFQSHTCCKAVNNRSGPQRPSVSESNNKYRTDD